MSRVDGGRKYFFTVFFYIPYILTFTISLPIDYFCSDESKLGNLTGLTGLTPGNLQLTDHNRMDPEELEDEELEQIR